jgi:F-type H+-transporting ATPase subunit delta
LRLQKLLHQFNYLRSNKKNIAEKLKVITGAKQIKLALKVDPSLIGGFTVEIGSKLIDTTIRGQLKQISNLLGAI